ncbi:MAG: TetR/AcrR family transcriptional regulator [Pseudomonadales bacterium]|nr:TetR/AcrR family transcriptional regulator [Pseudomonadales bacterium]
MNTTSRTRVDTKQNLITSALALFAAEGLDAVSMRTINSEAGARNASAVHYHFGSKLGIVEAVIDFVRAEFDQHRLPALEALEAKAAAGETPDAREVLWTVFHPYYLVHRTPEHGRAAIRFLARLQTEMSPEIQRLVNRDPHGIARRTDALLARALPELPAELRRTRFLFAWALMVHGFAGSGSWEDTALGDLRAPSGDVALMRFFEYLLGGLRAPVGDP